MATVAQIRSGIQTRLDTITGLRAFDLVNGKIPTPAAFVRPTGERDATQEAVLDWTFTIDMYVSVNSMRAAQTELDTFLPGGSKDVKAAVEADPSLGGVVGYAVVNLVDGSYDLVEVNEVVYLGCQFLVEVG